MHEVIAKGAARIRLRNGWTQEQAARAYRGAGLPSWQTSAVGSLECGMRRPRLDEVILMCVALGTTLAELLGESGEREITLGGNAVLTVTAIEGCFHPDIGRVPTVVAAQPPVLSFSDAERHAARKLGTTPDEVRRASLALWGRDFDQERDARVGDGGTPRARQARRGLAARPMLAEIKAAISTPRRR